MLKWIDVFIAPPLVPPAIAAPFGDIFRSFSIFTASRHPDGSALENCLIAVLLTVFIRSFVRKGYGIVLDILGVIVALYAGNRARQADLCQCGQAGHERPAGIISRPLNGL